MEGLEVDDPALEEALGHAAMAQRHLVRALIVLREAIVTDDPGRLDGPQGYEASIRLYEGEVARFLELRDQYVKDHRLTIVNTGG